MKTKNYLLLFLSILAMHGLKAQKPDSLKGRPWYIPNVMHAQFAGNIGMTAVGFGYELFHQHGQLSFFYGYVPEEVEAPPINAFSFKLAISPARIRLRSWKLMPYLGATVSYETGRNSFFTLPGYFPDGYYPTGNAVHATVFVGAKLRIPIGNNRTVGYLEPYVESGMTDTNLWYFISERQVNITEAASMAIGINYVFGKVKHRRNGQ